MTYEILILGGGYGAMRYVESMIWDTQFSITLCGFHKSGKTLALAERFALPYTDFESLKKEQVNHYDCVIVALPVAVKRYYIQQLTEEYGYHNIMIIEKPLALSEEDLAFYAEGIQQNRPHAVVCQRDFFPEDYYIVPDNNYHVVFPSYGEDQFNIIEMLPHVLSWLLTVDDSLEKLERVEENTYRGIWRKSDLTIEFIKRTDTNKASVNGTLYPDMQYRKANADIVKKVLSFDATDFAKNMDRAIRVSNIIMSILENTV